MDIETRAGTSPSLPSESPAAVAARRAPSWIRPVGVAVGVVVLQSLLVAFFAWPAMRTAPRDLPVVVAGPTAAVATVEGQLDSLRPGGFAVRGVADEAAADQALRDRKAYAAFLPGTDGTMTIHVASAASPTVASLLTQQLAGAQVRVVDVVPVDAHDPRGGGLASAFLPMLLTAIVAAALLWQAVKTRWGRWLGVLLFASLAGLAEAAILQYGYAALPGNYLANAGVLVLLAAAIAGSVTGLASVFGRIGVALGALVVFVLGNPLSAITSAPELLPQPWGAIGQFLPPGAGGTLLRSVAYFDGAASATAAWTLAAWAFVGLALIALYRPVSSRREYGEEH
jgi:hypothetical protein